MGSDVDKAWHNAPGGDRKIQAGIGRALVSPGFNGCRLSAVACLPRPGQGQQGEVGEMRFSLQGPPAGPRCLLVGGTTYLDGILPIATIVFSCADSNVVSTTNMPSRPGQPAWAFHPVSHHAAARRVEARILSSGRESTLGIPTTTKFQDASRCQDAPVGQPRGRREGSEII